MAPKRTTRSTQVPPVIPTPTATTTIVTEAQLQALINQGVTAILAARDALKSTNGDDNHNSGTGELALLCGRMFPEESDKIEKYIRGLPDMIQGSIVASKPKTMQEAVAITTELMDRKIRTFIEHCRSPAATNNHRNPTCYQCGNPGHYKSDCPELRNQDHGNQARGTGAHVVVHALEGGETNQDLNDVEDDINA
nr:hypothetical protein [Tanacetum cinerariifolium]